MTSKEYIIDRLNWLVTEVPDIKCTYVYDELCLSHHVEILPADKFHRSVILTEKQFEILDEFYGKYPEEIMGFMTENDLTELEGAPEFTVEGVLYDVGEKVSWSDFIVTTSNDINVGIKGVTGEVDYNNNYALAA